MVTSRQSHSRRRLAAVSVIWILLLAVGSLLPLRAKVAIGTVGTAHDAVHVAAFGGTALIFMLWAKNKLQEAGLAVVAFAIGVALEITQQRITGDMLEVTDIVSDLLGVLLGLACLQFRSVREPLEFLFRATRRDSSKPAGAYQCH